MRWRAIRLVALAWLQGYADTPHLLIRHDRAGFMVFDTRAGLRIGAWGLSAAAAIWEIERILRGGR